MNKNYKIAIALLGLAGLFYAYKKGLFTKKVSEARESTDSSEPSIPIVQTSSSSETPQVVDTKLPPQFTENLATANIPTIPGSYGSYAS